MKICRYLAAAVALAALGVRAGDEFRLYNVVPMYIGHEAEQAAKALEYVEKTGEPLVLYSLSLHPEGKPAQARADRYIESYRAFAKALEGTKAKPGVLVQSILGHWPRSGGVSENWTRTIDQDGKPVRFCPLDEDFGKYIDHVFGELAKTKPAFIMLDDDVRAFSHGCECFCEKHVELYNTVCQSKHTSESLREAIAESKFGDRIYDVFFFVQRRTMEYAVVGRIRHAIDTESKGVPVGVCVAGEEHYFCEPYARIAAAVDRTPVLRASTGCYCEGLGADSFLPSYFRIQAFAARYGGRGIDLLDEADTCPHNLWSKGARSFYTHLAAAAFNGYRGAKTWYVNSLRSDGTEVPHGYLDMLVRHRGQLDAIAHAVTNTTYRGVAMPAFVRPQKWHLFHDHEEFFCEGKATEKIAVPFGVPVCTAFDLDNATNYVFILDNAAEVSRMNDLELDALFSGNVMVFRDAAIAITDRGRSELTGVTAAMRQFSFSREYDKVQKTSLRYRPETSGSALFELLKTAKVKPEVLSEFVTRSADGTNDTVVAPATTYFKNRLGGRVITAAYHGAMPPLQQYSTARKRWFVNCLDRLSGSPGVVCGNEQSVLLTERVSEDGTTYLFVVNLGTDPLESLKLRLPANSAFERMDDRGGWEKLKSGREGDYAVLPITIGFYDFTVLRVRQTVDRNLLKIIQ